MKTKLKSTAPYTETLARFTRRYQAQNLLTLPQASWQAQQLLRLLHYMQTKKAFIAFQRANRPLQWVIATLIYYPDTFKHPFDVNKIEISVPYWDVRKRQWRTFKVESFLYWAPLSDGYFIEQSRFE